MGSDRRKPEWVALIDTSVTVSGMVSHFWDTSRTVGNMVAPYMARPSSDTISPFGDYATATLRIADYDVADGTASSTMERVSTPPTSELAAELDGAASWLDVTPDVLLLAALGRTIARVIGDGVTAVDVTDDRRWLLHAVPLICATPQQASATEVLIDVQRALATAPSYPADAASEILLNYVGAVPEGTMPIHETPPGLGHALEVRVYSSADLLHVDWWYDNARFDSYTLEELTEQFGLALIEMTSDVAAPL
jgi:hypothetical protein